MAINPALVKAFNVLLRQEGYRKRSTSWYRVLDRVYSIVNLQKSRSTDAVFVNVGFSLVNGAEAQWIPEQMCQVRFRADAIYEITHADLALLGHTPEPENRESWLAAVTERVAGPTVRTVIRVVDAATLNAILRSEVSDRIFVHRDLHGIVG